MTDSYSARNVTVAPGDRQAIFDVSRSATREDLGQAAAVSFHTADATAVSGRDYVATSGKLAFPPGATAAQVTVAVLADTDAASSGKAFYLMFEGFGAAQASLSQASAATDAQTYWLVPGTETPVAVPTSATQDAMARAQMNVKGFSDPPPDEVNLSLPEAYVRLGSAGADMNVFERVISQSEDFFARRYRKPPKAPKTAGMAPLSAPDRMQPLTPAETGRLPKEPGAMREFITPRNVNRKEEDVAEATKQNAHLDGIFLYTSGNMTTSVRGTASYMVGTDFVRHVGGETRLNYMGEVASTYLSGEGGTMRLVEGVTEVGAVGLDYEIKRTQTLEVAAEASVKYSLGAEFSAAWATQIELLNALKLEINNAIKLEVTGLEVTGKLHASGNYEAEYPGGEFASTKKEDLRTATSEILLQIDPAGAKARQTTVTLYAIGAALASAAASTSAMVPFVLDDAQFDKLANPDEMNAAFSHVMDYGLPGTFTALGAAGIAMLGLMLKKQKIDSYAQPTTPQIKMTKDELVLSCGTSSVTIKDGAVDIKTGTLDMNANFDVKFDTTRFNVDAHQTEFSASDSKFIGRMNVTGNVVMDASLRVAGTVNATNIDAGP